MNSEVDPRYEEKRPSEQSPDDHGAPVRIEVEETELVDPTRDNSRPSESESEPPEGKNVIVDDSRDPVSSD